MKKIALFLVCVMALLSVAFADVQFSSTSVSPSTLRPGNTGSISFTLTNTGTSGISGLTLSPSGKGIEFASGSISIGTIGASGSTPANLQFRVLPNTESGVYNLIITAYWNENTVSGGTGYKLVQIPITVSKQTIFQVQSEPMAVGIGEDFILNAQIKNTGGKASSIVLDMDSSYFIAKDSSKLILGDLSNGESVKVSMPLLTNLSMPAGIYSVPVTVTYQDELGIIQQASISLGTVQAVKGTADFSVVSSIDPQASPGNRIKMKVDVKNDGTLAAKSVKITVSSPSSSFTPLGSSQRLLGDIKAGDSASVLYDVGISSSASPGYYPVVVTIDYLNQQGEPQASATKNIGIEVVGVPKLAVITSTAPSPVVPGAKYSLGIQVSNIGTTDVKSLSVTLEGDSFTNLDNSPTTFIGNLKTDDYSQVSYNVLVDGGLLPGKYPITVRMSFMDSYNNRQEVVETSYVQVVGQDVAIAAGVASGGGLNISFVFVAILLIIVAAYFMYKRCTKGSGKKAQARI